MPVIIPCDGAGCKHCAQNQRMRDWLRGNMRITLLLILILSNLGWALAYSSQRATLVWTNNYLADIERHGQRLAGVR